MKTRTVAIQCDHGLHLRVASQITDVVRRHDAAVHVVGGGCRRADACSILQLVTLGAAQGERLDVVAEGPDEDVVIEQVLEVFEQGGGI